ncbi:CHAD domain-containing protein [Aromatoleum evansii]|uniref:CYTH and CHAD domain-containing protein n=1 Tax=Aromatoleum evansii TaxID=59406 RepID=UPI00145EE7C5|nr:CHAD domain-containing protein [Aromatoleum evansii]NMG29739.1 CHAD domain-containing protein [Aromatoleum evansii]
MSQEIELKLALPPRALPALKRHPLVAGAARQGSAKTLDNTYFDTPDLRLQARRIALRTRKQGHVDLQTVKCAAESTAGLTSRPEWEQPYCGSFDFSAVDAPKVRKLLTRHAAALVPAFSTRFRRETRLYAPDDKVRILMMIDTGEVIAGDRRAPICELELELVAGEPLDLLLLACRLAADNPLMPSDISKAERGYALHLGTRPEPARAEPSAIAPDHSPLAAFRALASACLRQWQANAVGATEDGAPEFIHQLRVALRRLRTLLSLFAPILPPEFVEHWRARLGENARAFAEARDLDVLYEEILAPVATDEAEHSGREADSVIALAERIRSERERARGEALLALDPAAQGRLMIGLTAALHALPDERARDERALADFAVRELERLRKKVRRRHAAAADRSRTHLHALRIALKRLRYALEFFAPLLPAKPTRRYLATIVRAQNALGFVHDVDVARTRLAHFAGDDAQLGAAVAFVCGWHGPGYARLGRRALRDVERLLQEDAPWAASRD